MRNQITRLPHHIPDTVREPPTLFRRTPSPCTPHPDTKHKWEENRVATPPPYSLRLGLLGDVPNGGTFFSYNGSNKLGRHQQAQRQVTGFLLGH